jgi:hypothetical protein
VLVQVQADVAGFRSGKRNPDELKRQPNRIKRLTLLAG